MRMWPHYPIYPLCWAWLPTGNADLFRTQTLISGGFASPWAARKQTLCEISVSQRLFDFLSNHIFQNSYCACVLRSVLHLKHMLTGCRNVQKNNSTICEVMCQKSDVTDPNFWVPQAKKFVFTSLKICFTQVANIKPPSLLLSQDSKFWSLDAYNTVYICIFYRFT